MQIWALMLDSFRESRDRKMFAALLIISTIVALSLGCIGFDEKGWSFFFGLYTLEHPIYRLGAPEIGEFYGSLVSLILIDKYIGWVAVGLSLVATAGIFPSFMQSGTIDVVLFAFFIVRGLKTKSPLMFLGAGIVAGLMSYEYEAFRVVPIIAVGALGIAASRIVLLDGKRSEARARLLELVRVA
ncbi:MAG: hypothetical protein IID37_14085, partial [Planctomycetes bacterium]|nr:hypothetical protein [Planctomycetota bacterium]